MNDSPRIYVASLSDYNAGLLHGVWIDLEGKDADEVSAEIAAMLRKSPNPNTVDSEGRPTAEEYAIHDYDNFHGIRIEEFLPVARAVLLASLLVNAGDDAPALGAYVNNLGLSYVDEGTGDKFEEAYRGNWDNEEDFAEEWAESVGLLPQIPEDVRYYFDFGRFANDLFLGDFYSISDGDGGVFVFRD